MAERKNSLYLLITFVLLAIKPSYDCILFFLKLVGIKLPFGIIPFYCLLLVFGGVVLFLHRPPLKYIIFYLAILAFYGINYLWAAKDAKQYFTNTDMAAILFVFTPIACMCTVGVADWKPLFNKKEYLISVDVIILISLISKITNYNTTGYMPYSYDLLPLWGICMVSALVFGHKLQWVFLPVGILEGLIYGARAPLFWLTILAMIAGIIAVREKIKNNRPKHLFRGLIITIVSLAVIAVAIMILLKTPLLKDSYVLKRIKAGSFFKSDIRKEGFSACRKVIAEMGWNIHGLFYDRTVLPDGKYSHNIVYETLISFGWILGSLFVIALSVFLVRTLIKQNSIGIVLAGYFVCCLFLRYLLSGSIFGERSFIIFLAAFYSLQAGHSTTLKKGTKRLVDE